MTSDLIQWRISLITELPIMHIDTYSMPLLRRNILASFLTEFIWWSLSLNIDGIAI